MGHVDCLDENAPHLAVANLTALETDAQMEADEFAVRSGQPSGHMSILVRDVQPCRKTVTGQQARVEIGAASGFLDLRLSQLREDFQADRLSRLRDVDVATRDRGESNWART